MESAARRFFLSGFFFWLVLGIFSVYLLIPLRKSLKFGIDLVGGTYVTLDVQVDEAVKHELQERLKILENQIKENNINIESQKVEKNKISVRFATTEDAKSAQEILREETEDMIASIDANTLNFSFPESKIKSIHEWAVQGNIEVLNTRLKKIGVEEITVAPKGERSIIVEFPDIEDPAKAKQMIGTPALLEFKLVEQMGRSEEAIADEFGGSIPEDMMIVKDNKKPIYYLVSEFADVTGRDLLDVAPGYQPGKFGMQPVVEFRLTPAGGDKFAELTGNNINRPLAAILDGRVVSVANINSEIHDKGIITGNFTQDEVKELSTLLKSGAFVAPVKFAEERSIGPSLGRESIQKGLLSCAVGLGLLLIFSVFYYKLSGLLAFITLIYNLLLLLVGLSLMRATLTLPGIAGIVLTLGMAIDSSVLIYEKIKELLATGMAVRQAVKEGFSDAVVVILDANITTFIVGVVLFKFGTGPIKGFAVTMMLGIISTLLTGIFFLRSLFNATLSSKKVQKLSI